MTKYVETQHGHWHISISERVRGSHIENATACGLGVIAAKNIREGGTIYGLCDECAKAQQGDN